MLTAEIGAHSLDLMCENVWANPTRTFPSISQLRKDSIRVHVRAELKD
jgi:hypothetical protein